MTKIRELNEAGMETLKSFILQAHSSPAHWPPPNILEDFQYAHAIPGDAVVERREFASKLEFGRYIVGATQDRMPERILRTSVGVWAWLTLFFFEQICPADSVGRRKVLKSIEKYVASKGHPSKSLDKHLLFFPWKMVALHGDAAAWLLNVPLGQDTKVVRELANSYRRNVSTPYIGLAKTLYFDAETGRVKTGATTNAKGSLRRLDRVMGQLDLTYDIFGIEAANLTSLLPQREFKRWLPQSLI